MTLKFSGFRVVVKVRAKFRGAMCSSSCVSVVTEKKTPMKTVLLVATSDSNYVLCVCMCVIVGKSAGVFSCCLQSGVFLYICKFKTVVKHCACIGHYVGACSFCCLCRFA